MAEFTEGRARRRARPWPASPLDAAERAYELLLQPPTRLGFDGCGVAGLPQRLLSLRELRALLLHRQTGPAVRDTVWADLVGRARLDGPAWVIAAVGLAMPGLRSSAGRLAAGWRGDTADLDAELLTGFVARLSTIDVDGPRICGRLLDAAVRAGRRFRDREQGLDVLPLQAVGPVLPARPFDHPDLVLVRAVAAGVIDADEARIVGATRLGEATVAQCADMLGISVALAYAWRRQAERRLADAIAAGELAFVALRPRRRAAAPG
ncbi:hypothetical protein [Dactylosporangium sp. NPDC051541]|uniref:hypothetical protein n=1 Tax=Dactylosporangium sp. NPDC051541 TaxID=3363977 RepID=UPI00378C82AF